MSDIDDGGAAFPRIASRGTSELDGMSLRDHFAGLAMASWMQMVMQMVAAEMKDAVMSEEGISRLAYKQADAMLEARK